MKTTAQNKLEKGFTLIELLVVIGILAILLSITLIAINPARQFSQANNTKRSSDVNAILNAVGQYAADNKGQLPASIGAGCVSGAPCEITNDPASSNSANLCQLLTTQYMAALPVDPLVNNGTQVTDCTATYDTGYTIYKGGDNRITVTAPKAELGQTITVTR